MASVSRIVRRVHEATNYSGTIESVREAESLEAVGHLALAQGLVEALAQGEVGLVLGALDELLDLPGAGSGRLVGVLLLVAVVVGLLLLLLLLLHVDWLLRLISATAAEHSSHGMSCDVADGRSDGDTSGGGSHLQEKTPNMTLKISLYEAGMRD